MNRAVRSAVVLGLGLAGLLILGGCLTDSSLVYVPGASGQTTQIGVVASVNVLTPQSDLPITGGTQVEVNWQATATSQFSVFDVIIDDDTDPNNGSVIVAYSNLDLSESSALVDTTALSQGTYYLGVLLRDVGAIIAFDYASGQIIVDQRPTLGFVSPRDNLVFDRSEQINPRIEVAWVLDDPDSQNVVDIFLDPDAAPNGNEILLYRSTAQTGDSFAFDLPTASFAPGTYRLLALVSDGRTSTSFYMSGSIRLRARLAGPVDLRDLDVPASGLSGAIFEGFNPRDNAGSFVTGTGDLDGDGFDDVLILSQFGKPDYQTNLQRTGIGEAYLIYGRPQRFAGLNNLNSTGVLFRGVIFRGVDELPDPIRPSRGITSYDTLADWDGDGVRELCFGLPFTDSVPTVNASGDTPTLDSVGAFRTGGISICAGANLRPSLGFPGGLVYNLGIFGQIDVGDDQVPPPCPESLYTPNSPGVAGPFTYTYRHIIGTGTTELELRLPGCRIHTAEFGDQCGETVSAYPFNGLLISVPNRDPVVNTNVGQSVPGAGVVSLYYGSYIWNLENDALPHNGPYRYILDDQRVVPVGPFLRQASPGYFVSNEGEPCLQIIDLNTPVPQSTVRFYGGFEGAGVGGARQIGDFSADGIDDFVIGSPLSNGGAGACFIVFGRLPQLIVGAELALEELGLPMNADDPQQQRIFDGVRVVGAPGERMGQSQSEAGDFNNDGIADVIIGSPLVTNRKGGAAVFYGSRTVGNLTQEEIPFGQIPSRGLGVIFMGEEEGDLAGARVANAGDVDGDGNSDILIAAPNRSVRLDLDFNGVPDIDRTNCGVVYLVYGAPDLGTRSTPGDPPGVLSLEYIGTEFVPGVAFIGQESFDFLGAGLGEQDDRSHGIATAGDVDGDGRADVMLGSVKAAPRNRVAAGETYLLYGAGD